MRRTKFKGIVMPDVKPLHLRESKMDTRKGMRKGKTKDHEVWKVLQLPLFGNPYESEPLTLPKLNPIKTEDDDMEPDYIKKYKNVMK